MNLLRPIFCCGSKRAMLVAAILLSGQTAMQADILSNNLSSPTADTEVLSGSTWIGGGFRTDANSYQLSSATLLISNSIPGVATLDVYSGIAQPSSFVGVLDSPSNYSSSLAETTFAGNVTLASNSTYWLVLKAASGQFEWGWTEDSIGSGVGFTHTWGASDDAGSSWFTTDIEPMQFSVTASPSTAVPEPAPTALLAMGVSLLWWRAARKFAPR
jgi:hypothetical protein